MENPASLPIANGSPSITMCENKRIAENTEVERIRIFFNGKTNYLREDKLSQSYISATFTKKEASDHGVSLYHLRSMFQAYCQDPTFTPSLDLPAECWKFWNIEKREELGKWFKSKPEKIIRRRVVKFLAVSTFAAALLTGVLTTMTKVLNLSGVEREKYLQAWQVINTAKDQTGMGGRNEALEYINKEASLWFTPKCKESKENNCLVGIKIQRANLNKVNLEGANLSASEFQKTSFREALLMNVNFGNAHLENTNFSGANLQGANFSGAKLREANFEGAKNVNVDKTFMGATMCNTTMPNGSVKKPECKE